MKKNYTYHDCYKILGIDPSCSWKELRQSYKHLIHKWHPDRYDDTSGEKALADEKIKSINIAYNQIQQYYRSNSTLPSATVDDPPTEKDKSQKQQPATEIRPETRVRKPPQVSTRQPEPEAAPKRRTFYTVIIALLSLTAFYNIYTGNMVDSPSGPSEQSDYGPSRGYDSHDNQKTSARTESGSSLNNTSKKPVQIKPEPAKALKYFTYGDSIGKVISAQGIPDRTLGDIWYYGESEVHFSYGRVTHWVRKTGSPLNIHLNFDPHRTQ